MDKFVRNLITEWRKLGLPFAAEKMLIAVSGGADSVSLWLGLNKLHELKKLELEFTVVHFNHGLRGAESDGDENFVRNLAENLNFSIICGKPKIKLQEQKGNLEQLARIARYDFFYNTAVAVDASFVLTAHTLNDQAETFLFNLLRGSGVDGLSAMPAKRILASDNEFQVELIRPLLSWAKREDTEAFCLENNIIFRQDTMNSETKFSRVRIRQELIPVLQTYNPKIIETLSRTAKLLKNDAELQRDEDLKPAEVLLVKELKQMSNHKRLCYLRSWIRERRGSLRQLKQAHFEAIENLVLSSKSGRTVELPNSGKVIKSQGKLSFKGNKVEKRRVAN